MDTKTPLAGMVADKRRSLNMSQAVLAEACGVSERTIVRVEAGERVSGETLMAICSVLGISPQTARAGMAEAPPTSIEVLPWFGRKTEAMREKGLRTLRSRMPDADAFAASDVVAGLASAEGLSWLRWSAGVKHAPSDEEELSSLVEDATPRPIRWLGAALSQVNRKLGLLGLVAASLVFTFLTLPIVVAPLAALGWICSQIPGGTVLYGVILLVGGGWLFHRHMTAENRLASLVGMVACVSPTVVGFAYGDECREYAASTCDEVEVAPSSDGRHFQLTVRIRGDYTTMRWIPSEPSLLKAVEAFRSSVRRERESRAAGGTHFGQAMNPA